MRVLWRKGLAFGCAARLCYVTRQAEADSETVTMLLAGSTSFVAVVEGIRQRVGGSREGG